MHRFTYNEEMPVESCTQSLCDLALRFGEDGEDSMVRHISMQRLVYADDPEIIAESNMKDSGNPITSRSMSFAPACCLSDQLSIRIADVSEKFMRSPMYSESSVWSSPACWRS